MSDEILNPGEINPVEEHPEVVVKAEEVVTSSAVSEPKVKAPAESVSFEESFGGSGDDYSKTFRPLKEGDVVQGVVVHIDREGVLVDVGTKSEGIIRRHELSRDSNLAAEDIVKVGERIDVYVLEPENQDGNLILSKKRADFEKAWEKVQQAKEEGRTLMAMVTDRVKGGLTVDLGIRGFVPASHVGNGSMKNNLEKYVGQSIPLKVIEVDKDRKKVVLSNKLAAEEDRQSRKVDTVNSLQPGQIRKGTVRRLTNYGAFIDLGGIDGLLHISEMSWTRILHPQEVLREGQDVDVVVLKLDIEAGRVSLGMRQILPDPWTTISDQYAVGDVITGVVSRQVQFGLFVTVEGGIEGIIPNAELNAKRGKGASPIAAGSEVEVKIIDLRAEERKMTLSLKQLKQESATGTDFDIESFNSDFEEGASAPAVETEATEPESASAETDNLTETLMEQAVSEPRQSDRGRRDSGRRDSSHKGGSSREHSSKSLSTDDAPRFTIGDALRAKVESAGLDSGD